jgi:hypothetical protein
MKIKCSETKNEGKKPVYRIPGFVTAHGNAADLHVGIKFELL